MFKILFPDNLHFHERGFKSLMEILKKKEITSIFMGAHNELKVLYGNYENQKTLFLEEYDELCTLSSDELFKTKFAGIELFPLIKAEMLSYLMTKENWYNSSVSSDEKKIFLKSYEEDKEDLLLNMAAAMFWMKFWKKRLTFKNYKDITSCIIFSGSLIYVKTLSSLLQNTSIRVFVVEHFFTGNDYYFEEKYTHIANNCDIKFKNYYNILKKNKSNKDIIEINKDKNKALNKLKLANNKNVVQPAKNGIHFGFNEDKKTLLILGQVINDFSILETRLKNINSLEIYKNIILNVLRETDYNIIFKAHPWERAKVNLKRSLTKDELQKFIYDNFTEEEKKRFVIVEDFNIEELFDYSEYIVALCSQSLLEAALTGKKTHQIGDAFFGNKGFTYDYNNEFQFIEKLKTSDLNSKLNLNEYTLLMEFYSILLEDYLVSVHDSGKSKLIKKLSPIETIKILNTKKENTLYPSIKPTYTEEQSITIDTMDISHNKSFKQRIITDIITSISSEKKVKKFKSNPSKFFDDSNYFLVKLIGKIY